MRQDNRLLPLHCWLGSNSTPPHPAPPLAVSSGSVLSPDLTRSSGHQGTQRLLCRPQGLSAARRAISSRREADEVVLTRARLPLHLPPPLPPVPFPVPARHTQLRHRPPQLLVQHALLSRSFIWNAKRAATGGSVSPQIKSFSDAHPRGGVCFFGLMHKALARHHTFYRFVSYSSGRLLVLPPSPPHHTDKRHLLLYCVHHFLPANYFPSAASVSPPLTLR